MHIHKLIPFLFILSGCVSNVRNTTLHNVQQERFTSIKKQLPVNNDKYSFNTVKMKDKDTLQLSILVMSESTDKENSSFLSDFAKALCNIEKNKQFLKLKGRYELVMSSRNGYYMTQSVDKNTCYDHQ